MRRYYVSYHVSRLRDDGVHQSAVISRENGPFTVRTGQRICHKWIIAPRRQDRARAVDGLDGTYYRIHAHRNLRGPYTGAGELIRLLIPQAYKRAPKLVEAYELTLLSIA